jgi:riboflavin synthase
MFTGIIQEMGVVKKVQRKGGGKSFSIKAKESVKDIHIGESLSVNGTCLTVLTVQSEEDTRSKQSPVKRHEILVEAGEETLERTTLEKFRPGEQVNLEWPLRVGDHLGGHFVLGHVDGKGRVRKKKALKSSTLMEIEIPGDLSPYMVEKGSISVDGVSLTIVSVQKNRFSVSLLPYTLKETTLGYRGVGDEVNIEVDYLAKHIHSLVKTNY